MKYSILIILTSILMAGDIKIACEKHLLNLYPDNTDFRMYILKLNKQIKKEVENQAKLSISNGSAPSMDGPLFRLAIWILFPISRTSRKLYIVNGEPETSNERGVLGVSIAETRTRYAG